MSTPENKGKLIQFPAEIMERVHQELFNHAMANPPQDSTEQLLDDGA